MSGTFAKVALKVLKPDLDAIVGVDRFLAEIDVTANLQRPNLLALFDSGATAGLPFYVMPYVQEESLREALHADPASKVFVLMNWQRLLDTSDRAVGGR